MGRRKPESWGPQVLRLLREGLSTRQFDEVVVAAFECLAEGKAEAFLAKLDRQVAGVVRHALAGETRQVRPAAARILEDWRSGWAEWREVIAETGSEDGGFVGSDAEWDSPYLDLGLVAERLEDVARRLAPFVERVWREGLDPSFDPERIVAETAGDLGAGLPEWLEIEEPLILGPTATRVLLTLAGLEERDEEEAGPRFLRRIREIEDAGDPLVRLDGATVRSVVLGGPPADRASMFRALRALEGDADWAGVLFSPWSYWAEIYLDLAAEQDRDVWLGLARRRVAGDFREALPVAAEYETRCDLAGARSVLLEGLGSAIGLRDRPFDPRLDLLAGRFPVWRSECERADLNRLLDALPDVLRRAGDTSAAALLDVQRRILSAPGDWEGVLGALRPVADEEARESLFRAWRDLQIRKTGVSWAGPLLEALWCGEDHPAAFLAGIRGRAQAKPAGRPDGGECRDLAVLALLTGGEDLVRRRPWLVKWLEGLVPDPAAPDLRASMSIALRRAGCDALLPEIIGSLDRRLQLEVPDPWSSPGADYRRCAVALAALAESAPAAAEEILARWRTEHRRRRNLWSALRSVGLA